jgi:hypothetical protein
MRIRIKGDHVSRRTSVAPYCRSIGPSAILSLLLLEKGCNIIAFTPFLHAFDFLANYVGLVCLGERSSLESADI